MPLLLTGPLWHSSAGVERNRNIPPRYAIRLDDLRTWHVVFATCAACGKRSGGGSLGVVTRLTLRTHALPEFFGAAFMTIKATSDAAFRRLIGRVVGFYNESLFNPHWGEQIAF